ncbi:hypothetical protein PO124_18055 [Bacillus licheniformis]|nr:hypothetical protein [Bacillus licheniformis]
MGILLPVKELQYVLCIIILQLSADDYAFSVSLIRALSATSSCRSARKRPLSTVT